MSFELSYAGIPFLLDFAKIPRMKPEEESYHDENLATYFPRKYQPDGELTEQLDRMIRTELSQIISEENPTTANLQDLPWSEAHQPRPDLIGFNKFYYPTNATRYGVFVGLMTSAMVRDVVTATQGGRALATFKMVGAPRSNLNAGQVSANYTISTQMAMLPPRLLGEDGTAGIKRDGLYAVVLVDTRYDWQQKHVTLKPDGTTTWEDLLAEVATALGEDIEFLSTPEDVYGVPEPDSQLWASSENAAILLDAIAYNTGRTVVRTLDGVINLMTHEESDTTVALNRPLIEVLERYAGGDMFQRFERNNANDLNTTKNSIAPKEIIVNFPTYVDQNAPIPHYVNDRNRGQQQTSRFTRSPGGVFQVTVPIQSGPVYSSGISGAGSHFITTTAKALLDSESDATPSNSSGLTALALQLANDYWEERTITGLDEVYPGIFAWSPEGLHDIVWTYSAFSRQVTTRVFRSPWTYSKEQFQTATPKASGQSPVVLGGGGHPVAQTWRDGQSSGTTIQTELAESMAFDATTATFDHINFFPTDRRWKATIDNETILFEGTSGGTTVGVARRPIDGTVAGSHDAAATVVHQTPNQTYAVNFVELDANNYATPNANTSGGVNSIKLLQSQTVNVLSSGSITINGVKYQSGRIQRYNGSGSLFQDDSDLVWISDRNGGTLTSGLNYHSQFLGYATSGGGRVYGANVEGAGGGGGAGSGIATLNTLSGNTVANTLSIEADNRQGVHFTNGLSGTGSVNLTVFDAGENQVGVVNSGYQFLGGTKTVRNRLFMFAYGSGTNGNVEYNQLIMSQDGQSVSGAFNSGIALALTGTPASGDYCEFLYGRGDPSDTRRSEIGLGINYSQNGSEAPAQATFRISTDSTNGAGVGVPGFFFRGGASGRIPDFFIESSSGHVVGQGLGRGDTSGIFVCNVKYVGGFAVGTAIGNQSITTTVNNRGNLTSGGDLFVGDPVHSGSLTTLPINQSGSCSGQYVTPVFSGGVWGLQWQDVPSVGGLPGASGTGSISIASGGGYVQITPSTSGQVPIYNGTTVQWTNTPNDYFTNILQARLSHRSGELYSDNASPSTNLYVVPFDQGLDDDSNVGNAIAVNQSGSVILRHFSGTLSVTAASMTANTTNDVGVLWSGGQWGIRTLQWGTTTDRQELLQETNGLIHFSGFPEIRMMGTIYVGSGRIWDGPATRLVSNWHDQTQRSLKRVEATNSWTVTAAAGPTWQLLNLTSGNRIEMVRTRNDSAVHLDFHQLTSISAGTVSVGMDIDGVSTGSDADVFPSTNPNNLTPLIATALYNGKPGAGYHFIQLMELPNTVNNATFFGDIGNSSLYQAGATGWVMN